MGYVITPTCDGCGLTPAAPNNIPLSLIIGASERQIVAAPPEGWVHLFDPLSGMTDIKLFCPKCRKDLTEEGISRTAELLKKAGLYARMVGKERASRSG